MVRLFKYHRFLIFGYVVQLSCYCCLRFQFGTASQRCIQELPILLIVIPPEALSHIRRYGTPARLIWLTNPYTSCFGNCSVSWYISLTSLMPAFQISRSLYVLIFSGIYPSGSTQYASRNTHDEFYLTDPGIGSSSLSLSFSSVTNTLVVNIRPATEAAISSAVLATFAGSMMPALNISTNCPVLAS